MKAWLIIVLLLCDGLVHAADTDEAAERARLAAERASVEARHDERVLACQDEFFVAACLDSAQAQRREGLERVRLQRQALDDALRKRRAADRLRRIHEKVGAQSAAAAAPPRALRAPKQRAPERLDGGPAAAPREAAASTQPAASAPGRSGQRLDEKNKRAAELARREQATQHRIELERRRAERAARHKRAAPLPVPAAASQREAR